MLAAEAQLQPRAHSHRFIVLDATLKHHGLIRVVCQEQDASIMPQSRPLTVRYNMSRLATARNEVPNKKHIMR